MKFRVAVVAVTLAVVGLVVASPAAAATHGPKVTLSASHRSVRAGATVTLSGRVSPSQRAHRIWLQRYYHRAWHGVQSTKLPSSSRFSFRVKLTRTGKYEYRISDPKTRSARATTSRPVTVSVTAKPKPPKPTGCYPLTNSGNCYEPGEYCRDSDHGVTGVAGDGETITCEDNDGWRWEPS